jgi:ligand-binding SRPBCC domain-containing protein
MSARFETEQWVGVPIEQVFLFFANPQNLPRIMPPSTGTKLLRVTLKPPPDGVARPAGSDEIPVAGVGSEIVTSFRVAPFLPLRARWTALITEFEWNDHFADTQVKGPFKRFQHRHQLSAETQNGVAGTRVRDVINYEVGFGLIGPLAEEWFVKAQLQKTFRYRQQALLKLLQQD